MSITLHHGDCRDVLASMAMLDETVDSVVCDPPYGLVSIVERFGKESATAAKPGKDGAFSRVSQNFIGSKWDATGIERDPEFWLLVASVMKPGAFCLAFSSARTGHRQACAMEDAGLVMHPFIPWLYSQGLPKPHHVKDDAWNGWMFGAATLKGCVEPVYVAQKPFSERTGTANVLKHGTGAYNIAGCTDPATGRYPMNVAHDGSEDVLKALGKGGEIFPAYYHRKANKSDRGESKHPTVKPIGLMRWLIRLVTPPGGTVLDPFAGSGSTGVAALEEGMNAILIEADDQHAGAMQERFWPSGLF